MSGIDNIEDFGKKDPKVRTTFTIDKGFLAKLTKIAEARALSKSAIVNDLIKVYVERSESLI